MQLSEFTCSSPHSPFTLCVRTGWFDIVSRMLSSLLPLSLLSSKSSISFICYCWISSGLRARDTSLFKNSELTLPAVDATMSAIWSKIYPFWESFWPLGLEVLLSKDTLILGPFWISIYCSKPSCTSSNLWISSNSANLLTSWFALFDYTVGSLLSYSAILLLLIFIFNINRFRIKFIILGDNIGRYERWRAMLVFQI